MATETLRPNAAGDYTNITYQTPLTGSHWDKVDEEVADDVDTYVWAMSTAQLKDAYKLQNTAIPSSSVINSVTVYFRCLLNYGIRFAQPFLRLGTDETAGTEVTGAGDEGYKTRNETLARPGGGTWAVSDLNSLQVCMGLRSRTSGIVTHFTQVYVVVDYTLPTPVVDGGLIGIPIIRKS